MARYFFDTKDGDNDTDDTGSEIANDEEAMREAIRFAGSMIRDQPEILTHRSEFVVSARADGGRVVAQVRVSLDQPTRR